MTTVTDGAGRGRPSTTGTAPAWAPRQRSTGSPTAPPAPVRLRARRRPALLALGVALVVTGVLGGVWLVTAAGQRTSVLAVARPVPFGAVITVEDLRRAEVSVDATVATVPASDVDSVVGRVAATDLLQGQLLSAAAVTDAGPPSPGQVLVALAVPATRMPAGSLQAGDRVLVVETPAVDADAPTLPPAALPATVVRLGEPDLNGVTVVDVTVAEPDGPALAARAATGRIAVVLQPRGR